MPQIGYTPETLRVWVRQHEQDTGGSDGGLTAERQRLKNERKIVNCAAMISFAKPLFCEGGSMPLEKKVIPLLDKLRKLASQTGMRLPRQRIALSAATSSDKRSARAAPMTGEERYARIR